MGLRPIPDHVLNFMRGVGRDQPSDYGVHLRKKELMLKNETHKNKNSPAYKL